MRWMELQEQVKGAVQGGDVKQGLTISVGSPVVPVGAWDVVHIE
jgi:hypothetical protein